MKKLLLFLLPLLVLLSSCEKEAGHPLFYREGECLVEGIYTKNGVSYRVSLVRKADGSGSVSYLSPENARDFTFSVSEGEETLLCGEYAFSLGKIASDASVLLSLLSLKEEEILSIGLEEKDGRASNRLSFRDASVWLDPETGFPFCFASSREGREIAFSVVGFQYAEEGEK